MIEFLEIVQPAQEIVLTTSHDLCCPPLPFIPHLLQFPPAGYFHMILCSMWLYIHVFVDPLLLAEEGFESGISKEVAPMRYAERLRVSKSLSITIKMAYSPALHRCHGPCESFI